MIPAVLVIASLLQAVAVAYGFVLASQRGGAGTAWLLLIGAMLSMLSWRVLVMTGAHLPPSFNAVIAIWGSTCMLGAMLLFAREIRRRERAEAQRDQLLTSERAARTEAERVGRLKDEFLATLSHELRTPLSAILGWCALVRLNRDGGLDVPRGIETIERNARVQVRLVDDLLDATHIQAGTLRVDSVPVQLAVPVQSALEVVRLSAKAKDLALVLHGEGEPPVVRGDAGRLQQIAVNLLANAIKFTPPNGRIDVTVAASGDRASLVVADNGEGIDSGFLPQLFTRFRQADSTVARRHGGLGLGLSIAMSLTRLQGGDIRAESAGAGHGATFTVTFPLDSTAIAPDAPATPESGQLPHRVLDGVRTIVIDDEPDNRSAVRALLEHAGAEVVALESGETVALALQEFRPHVLIIDISMPGEDGYAVIARIRRLPAEQGGDTPAVSLTAHARSEDRTRAMTSGFQEHLAKPVDVPHLLATLRCLADRTTRITPPVGRSARVPLSSTAV